MKKLLARLEGTALVLLGLYIFILIQDGRYAYYLHPKFKWLSAISATVLIGLGGVRVCRPSKTGNLVRLCI